MEQTFESLTHWLASHQNLILVAIAIISFAESLALVGILVPGIALLFAAAVAAGSVHMPLPGVLAAGFVGSILGDGISFLLGYHYHGWIRQLPLLRKHPQWIEKGEAFFRQYGLMGIVLGRFIGPIRPVMPLIAGFMQMPRSRFFTINLISALAWAPAYLMPGYLVGASLEGQHALSARHIGFILGALLCGWLLAQIIWWLHQRIGNRRQKILLALLTTASCCALFIMVSQLMQLSAIVALNQQFALWAVSLRQIWLDIFFVGLTQIGYRDPMILWAACVTMALVWQRNLYAAALWVGTLLFGQLLLRAMKNGFAWPRPPLVSSLPESYAFPSGHTTMALVFLGTLAILCLPGIPHRRQKAVLSGVAMLVMTVAASRLYLTVHWLTDIIGGILLGGMVLGLLYTLILKQPFIRVRPWPVVIATLFAWIASLGYWVLPHFTDILQRYRPLAG
ncbi:bifunctional DedA family/phosphatase PAP2 family protein [Ketobacter sp.]|nr:MAG: phosphatase PAP2 family protein [Ketobacter sp.]